MFKRWHPSSVRDFIAVLPFILILSLLGCAELSDVMEKSKPSVTDSAEELNAKALLAQRQAEWAKQKLALESQIKMIRSQTQIKIDTLQEELDHQKRVNEEQVRQLKAKFDSELFPYRYFYLGALAIVVVMVVIAYMRKNIPLAITGIALSFVLLGIAQIQKAYPQVFVYCTIGCIIPVAVYFVAYGVSWLRKEQAIKVMAQAI